MTDQATIGSYRWFVVGVLFLVFASAYVDRQIMALLLPSLKTSFTLSDSQLGVLQGSAFAFVYVLAALPLGRLVDRTHRRNLLVVGVLLWSFATIASGFVSSYGQLLVARVLVGIGEACIAPTSVSLVGDYFTTHERGRANSLILAGASVGSSVALVGGGALLAHHTGSSWPALVPSDWEGWRVVFVVAGLPGILISLLLLAVREPSRIQDGTAQHGSAITPFLRERGKTFILFIIAFSALQFGAYGAISWGPTLLIRVYGLGPAQAGAIYGTIILVCSLMGTAGSGFLSDFLVRKQPEDGRILALLIFIPIELVCWSVVSQTGSLPVLVSVIALSSFAVGMSIGSAYTALQEIVPRAMCGRAIAIYLFFATLIGLGCGPLAVALVTEHIFADEMMLQQSMATIVLSSFTVALVTAIALRPLYRSARRNIMEAETQEQAAPVTASSQ